MSQGYSVGDNLRRDWPVLLLLAAMFVGSAVIYPDLPDQVPTHFNAGGQVDDYSSRFSGAFGLPLVSLAIYALMLFVPLVDPKRQNYIGFVGTYRLLRFTIVAFMAVTQGIILATALGDDVPVAQVMAVALGAMFVVLGLCIKNVDFNYFVGIRTPWTLANEEVWRRTHRQGGRLLTAAGVVAFLGAVLPPPTSFFVAIGAVLAATMITVVYSYFVFAAVKRENP